MIETNVKNNTCPTFTPATKFGFKYINLRQPRSSE